MQRVSLQECVIYEPGASTSPILLHNVPIRDSRHCGSVHHLAPATSTPGERDRDGEGREKERKKEGSQRSALSRHQLSPLGLRRGRDQLHACTAGQGEKRR